MKILAWIFSPQTGILDSKMSPSMVSSSPSSASNASGDSIFTARNDHRDGIQFN